MSASLASDITLDAPTSQAVLSVCPDIGIMLFDNPKECAAGWASVNGDKAIYVRHHSDLANNVIWITNGEFGQFITLGHLSVHNLRSLTFFRTQINQICHDLGYEIAGAFAQSAAQKISKIATRVFQLAAQSYEWKPGELGDAISLYECIKSRFPKECYPNHPALTRALQSAYQTDSAITRADFLPNTVFLTLRLNRFTHAQNVLACPIPDDAWEYVPKAKLPASPKERLSLCLNQEAPILAQVTIDMTQADSAYAALCAFGQKVTSRMVLREWISHPELIWLSRFAPIDIQAWFQATEYKVLPETMCLPRALTEDPFMGLSYSAGLLAENHWMALASDEYRKWTKKKSLTSRAVWLRAADRALCFALAKKALDKGFMVTGYSTGAVRVRILRTELLQALEFAIENHIVCPDFSRVIQEDDFDGICEERSR